MKRTSRDSAFWSGVDLVAVATGILGIAVLGYYGAKALGSAVGTAIGKGVTTPPAKP